MRYLIAFTILLLNYTYAHAGISKHEINCGVGTLISDTFTVSEVTTDIPFITRQTNPNYAFGCAVKYLKGEFSLWSSIIVPNPQLKTLTTNAYLSTESNKDGFLIKSEAKTFDNTGYVSFQLDDSDLSGNYILEIYINNNFSRKVKFNVYK